MRREMTVLIGILFAAAISALPLHSVELPLGSDDDVAEGSVRDPRIWNRGGIDGYRLPVGQPNSYDRNDKVIFRFPLASFIPGGKVGKAVLRFKAWADDRNSRPEKLKFEHFTTDRRELTRQALISQEVESVGSVITLAPGPITDMKIDVTSAVNHDLEKGYVYVNFLVSSLTAERFGAPENLKINCADIDKDSLVLDVTP